MNRETPSTGFVERSKATRKLSVALPSDMMDGVTAAASELGVSSGAIVRAAVHQWLEAPRFAPGQDEADG